MSGHTVPVDAGGSPLPLPLSKLVCGPRTPTTYTPIFGRADASKWGKRIRKREMERREGKNPVPVSRGSFCSLKWLPRGSEGCGHRGGGWRW